MSWFLHEIKKKLFWETAFLIYTQTNGTKEDSAFLYITSMSLFWAKILVSRQLLRRLPLCISWVLQTWSWPPYVIGTFSWYFLSSPPFHMNSRRPTKQNVIAHICVYLVFFLWGGVQHPTGHAQTFEAQVVLQSPAKNSNIWNLSLLLFLNYWLLIHTLILPVPKK